MKRIEIYMRGWLNYYGIADMESNIESLNGWLYRRIRMCIWKLEMKSQNDKMSYLIYAASGIGEANSRRR